MKRIFKKAQFDSEFIELDIDAIEHKLWNNFNKIDPHRCRKLKKYLKPGELTAETMKNLRDGTFQFQDAEKEMSDMFAGVVDFYSSLLK